MTLTTRLILGLAVLVTIIAAVSTFAAQRIDGELVRDAYLFLECEVDRIIDGFGDNSLICGRIVVAHAYRGAIRHEDVDDQDVIADVPALIYPETQDIQG